MKVVVLMILAIAVLAIPIFSQAPVTARPQFEVASIKIHPPPLTRILVTNQGGRFVATGISLKMLVGRGYGVPEPRVLEGPSWTESERYDIEAKASDGAAPNQLQPMIKALLEDRFKLKAHKETRDLPVYELVVSKNGPKIKLSEDQTPPAPLVAPAGGRGAGPQPGPGPATRGPIPGPPPGQGAGPFPGGPPPRGAMSTAPSNGKTALQGTAITLSALANALQQRVDRPVIDKTGLMGLFDVKLEWSPGAEAPVGPFGPNPNAPPAPPDDSGPTIFTAVQEQLGLRLESGKAPLDVVVIENAEKPSEN